MTASGGGDDEAPRNRGASSRWPKGKSGNPKGRPPNDTTSSASTLSLAMSDLLISEAEREITLSEGGKPVTMTAGQAVLRATLVSALKGNANAQRTFLQMATAAQMQSAKNKRDQYEAAFLMQLDVQIALYEWIKHGLSEADFPRHPSDIELDPRTGDVKNFLIYTDDAVEARNRLIAHRDYLIDQFARMLEVAEQEGNDALLERGRERASRLIDTLNEQLPLRFRRFLPHEVQSPSGYDAPEEIWRSIARDDAASLCNKTKQREIQGRRRSVAKNTKSGG